MIIKVLLMVIILRCVAVMREGRREGGKGKGGNGGGGGGGYG